MEDKFATCYPTTEDKSQGPLDKTRDSDSISDREEELNNKLRIFVRNCQIMNAPVNTIGKQLGCMEKRYVRLAYTEIGSGKQLPLSDEFHQHCRAFISPEYTTTAMRYKNTVILIQHLKNVAGRIDKTTVTNQMLAHGSLQILRALLHNIIVILPGDILTSKRKTRKYRIRLQQLQELQDLYVSEGLVHLVMTLIGTQNQAIFRESLALLEYMLFGTGKKVQDAALDFFEQSREEALFMIINDFLKYSAELMKERRFIADRSEKQIMKQKTEEYQKVHKNGFFAKLSFKSSQKQAKVGIINSYQTDDTFQQRSPHTKQDFFQEQTLRMNTRTIQLILNVVAKLADGYHVGLQDYLREQPDNLKSFNIVAAVTEYLGNMYTYVNKDNIELTVDIFDALGKACLGNQKNRLVILDNKIIDCVNYILKQRSWEGCSPTSVLNLKRSVSKLLMSLTEENSPSALQVAKDVAQTLDMEAVLSNMETCQQMEQNITGVTSTVGHRMYIIFSRMKDIISNAEDNQWLALATEHKSVLDHYKSQVYSIEIVKDGYLQKAYFPFDKAHYVRDDLKRRLKWNVDRTSPTNKIRDFMMWSNVIIRDYYHQEKILSSFMGRLVVRRRIAWDYLLVLLSFLINLYMLVCWVGQDPDTTKNIHKLTTTSPVVRFDFKSLKYTLLSCEILHNIVSLMLLCSYFLAQHPSLPRWCSRTKKEDMTSSVDMEGPESKTHNYNTKLFSAKTAYYFVLSIMSIVGTAVTPYCFAFHLLHIVEVNTLLQGVIRAITKNGKSLLWVAILGFCVLYIYGLIGFAFFRHIFEPTNQLYCKTLYECTTTVSTYGLIGLMGEMVTLHSEDNSFLIFLSWAAYQITFFIFFSTIGLNIIFGIIVDTFSELRDMKWRAEKDMHDVCFICGLPSYDFEHHTKGFYHHTHYEHNMWTYIYYFIYLSTTNRSEYTALDYYVADQRRRGLVEFFPANRALSLSFLEQNKEDILDELRKDITFLKQRQQQLDIERHLQEQDKKQKQWRHILLSQLSMSSATESLTRTPPVELPSIKEEVKQDMPVEK